jgi:tetratricopeptide (TPR) repeat protein
MVRKIALSLMILICAVAFADEITLPDGRKIEGMIIKEDEKGVTIETAHGVYTFKEVVAIDKKHESKVEIFYKKLERIKDSKKASDFYKLSLWAWDKGLYKQRKDMLKKVIKLDPNHSVARELLGYVFFKGKWMTYAEANRKKGLIYYKGRWITKANKELQELKKIHTNIKRIKRELEKEKRRIKRELKKEKKEAPPPEGKKPPYPPRPPWPWPWPWRYYYPGEYEFYWDWWFWAVPAQESETQITIIPSPSKSAKNIKK